MNTRPPRPKAYCLPSVIELKPVKERFRKPYWLVKTDQYGGCRCENKAQAYDYLNRRMAKTKMTDQELYESLYRSCGSVLVNEWAYFIHRDGTYTAKDDKHEWYHADEVNMLFWLSDQGHTMQGMR